MKYNVAFSFSFSAPLKVERISKGFSGLLRCLVHFISGYFSDRGFKRWEWMTHKLSSFPKPLMCPLELCLLSTLVWLQTTLWWRPITPALFLMETNTLSLRMRLNHQCLGNLLMDIITNEQFLWSAKQQINK